MIIYFSFLSLAERATAAHFACSDQEVLGEFYGIVKSLGGDGVNAVQKLHIDTFCGWIHES